MQVVREILDVMSMRSPRLEILGFYTYPMTLAKIIVPYCKRWRHLRLLLNVHIDDVENEMEDEPFVFKNIFFVYEHTRNELKNLFMQCPSLHCIADPQWVITCHYSRSSGILRFYARLDFNALHHKQNISFY